MTDKQEILSYLKENKAVLERDFSIKKIGLIGSFSRDEQHAGSDIDLIAEFKRGTQGLTILKERLRKMVEKEFSTKVEICRGKYLKPYYKKHILKDAIYI